MAARTDHQILQGLWQFEALHPEWTEEEREDDGWEQSVASWAVATPDGLVLIDPLIDDWEALDALVAGASGCAGVVRTCHWHQRSIDDVVRRYGASVWARRDPDGRVGQPLDHAVGDRQELFERLMVIDVERADEVGLWLPHQRALVFGDAMIRSGTGELRVARIRGHSPRAARHGCARCSPMSPSLRSSTCSCLMVRSSSATGSRRCGAP